MIQVTPHMRVLLAVAPVDFRKGIDAIARVCRERLNADPFSGTAFVFRSRRGTALRILVYDGQGYWLCHKRLSAGKFRWPTAADSAAALSIRAHELSVLIFGGDPKAAKGAPVWRSVNPVTHPEG
jgi:transposase